METRKSWCKNKNFFFCWEVEIKAAAGQIDDVTGKKLNGGGRHRQLENFFGSIDLIQFAKLAVGFMGKF